MSVRDPGAIMSNFVPEATPFRDLGGVWAACGIRKIERPRLKKGNVKCFKVGDEVLAAHGTALGYRKKGGI